MNKSFIKKIIQAEMLRYEAIKEILPDNVRGRIDSFEKEAINIIKDIALDFLMGDAREESRTNQKESRKVNVDFN